MSHACTCNSYTCTASSLVSLIHECKLKTGNADDQLYNGYAHAEKRTDSIIRPQSMH